MDTFNVILSLISFGSLSYSVKQHLNINANDRKLKQFIKTRIFSPKDLIFGIKEKEGYLVNQFKEHGENEISGKLFVEGLPYTNLPLNSRITKTKNKLLYRIFFQEDIFSNDNIHGSSKQENIYQYPKNAQKEKVPWFSLKDYDESNKCLIMNNNFEDGPNCQAALEVIAVKEELRPLTFLEKMMVFICMALDYLSFLDGGSKIRGIKIGIREKELGIKIDSFLTVFGEVIYNFEKQTLRIESPEYFLKSKSNLLEILRENISECQTKRIIFAIIGLACLGIIGYRLYQKHREHRAELNG